mgnify:FL=1
MKIDSVKIENFRQYRDVKIDFSKDSNKNFTIIQGNNGTGKTTLLNALSWCLYGEEIHDYKDESSMNICNNKTAYTAKNGENFKVMVEIKFIDEDKPLIFNRTLHFHKTDDKLIKDAFGDEFQVGKMVENQLEFTENDYYTREQKIPEDIENYFFFDGARLSEYFQKDKKIRESVYNLSQLNLVENVDKHLEKVITKYSSKLKKIEPDLGKSVEDLTNAEIEIKNKEKLIEESKEIIEEAKWHIKDYTERLSKFDSIKKDINRDKQLEKDLNILNKELNDLNNNKKNLILKTYPYLLAYDTFTNFLDEGRKYVKNGYLPPDFKREFIEELLNNKKCLCGLDLSTHEENRNNLEIILKNTSPITDINDEINIALSKVKTILQEISKFKVSITEIEEKIKNKEKESSKKSEERESISNQLKDNPEKEITKYQYLKEKYSDSKDKHQRNIGRYESEIRILNDKIKTLKLKSSKEKSLKIEAEELNQKIIFSKKVIQAAHEVNTNLTKEMKNRVEDLTQDKFIKIQWKKDEFTDIRLNENYEIYIKNKLGDEERPGDLSDGEKLCLGLCFISALHSISGFNLPTIMDTPLGNLDKDMRHNIAKFLPEFVNGDQIILLVTGTEYTDDFRDTLYDYIGKEYVINWTGSEEGKESKVISNEL